MSTTLTKLPGSKWWIETDDATSEIVGQYNKAQITDRIQYLNTVLPMYADLAQTASDIADLQAAIVGKWTAAKNTRITTLLVAMWAEHQTSTNYSKRAADRDQMQAEHDRLVTLKARLV